MSDVVFRRRTPTLLLNPETGLHEVPRAGVPYAKNHPLVKAHAWAFGTPDEIAQEAQDASTPIGSVAIETADGGSRRRRSTPHNK